MLTTVFGSSKASREARGMAGARAPAEERAHSKPGAPASRGTQASKQEAAASWGSEASPRLSRMLPPSAKAAVSAVPGV